MIERIGVIYEDAISLGFLLGLRDRLGCDAELIRPTPAIGGSTHLTRRTAKRAWRYFQKQGVDLVVLFTDANGKRWQSVRRDAGDLFPAETTGMFVCGVAVSEVEDWLALDRRHIAHVLGLDPRQLDDAAHRADRIKCALARSKRNDEHMSAAVARIVREAPGPVIQRWLKADASLCEFYSDCRDAARRADCETPSGLGAPA